MADMKEISDAALAYYHNLSEKQKLEVHTFFRNLDKDGDEAITIKEFEQIYGGRSTKNSDHIFREVDKNGDGLLNFDECVTLFYSHVHQRTIPCYGCGTPFLKGLYFTCVDCFDNNQTTTFDLCTSCYRSRNYFHRHSNFLDNYALLRSKAACNKSGSTNQGVRVESFNSGSTNQLVSRSGSRRNEILKAVNTGIGVVNTSMGVVNTSMGVANTVVNIATIASWCSIM